MNGAIAAPLVETNSAPIARQNRTIGVSHHFFLTLRKSQIIFSFCIADPSVREERPRARAVLFSRNPVAFLTPIEFKGKQIFTDQS